MAVPVAIRPLRVPHLSSLHAYRRGTDREGLSQLQRANEGIERRQEIAKKYDEAFANTCIKSKKVPPSVKHAYHLYVIEVEDRKGLYDYLRNHNIFAQVHYIPVHTMPYYQSLGNKKGSMPKAETYYSRCLSLPMYPTLSDEEQDYVINKIKNYYNGN